MTKLFLTAFLVGVTFFTWAQWKFVEYENRVREAEADAAYARESEQKLLSGGRWVREIAANGQSTYRFARKKEQR